MAAAAKYAGGPLEAVAVRTVSGQADAKTLLDKVTVRGGEGLMLRNPALKYSAGRTAEMLKFKQDILQNS